MKMILVLALTLAHSWYPSDCCGDMDCKPVPCDQLIEQDDGKWEYTPTHNVFPQEQVRHSQDKDCHVCLGASDKRSLCAFIQHNV